jgi:transposase
MKRHRTKKELERITVDRKIVEGLMSGQSLTQLTSSFRKGKGYVIKIRDLALEHGFVEPVADNKQNIFKPGPTPLPPYPEALFAFIDRRSEKASETDVLLESKRDWVKERLEAGWSPQTIFEELGTAVPRSNFYRYLHRQSLMRSALCRNVIEIVHGPGECLQIDWGKLFDIVDRATGKKKTVWALVGILGHSRYEMCRVVEKLDFRTTIECLISMLEEIGGVPRKLTSDNPKVFVQEASEYEPLLNPAFERFAHAYGFTVEALPPAAPEKKGKVERRMPVMRRLFESFSREGYTLESAQAHIDRKLKLTNERKHGTHLQKPIDVFVNDESDALKRLPAVRYELETIVSSTVRADGYVRFENKYYRVDSRLKGESALVIASSCQVSIYARGRLLEVYDRITDRFTTKACKDHYREPWEKTLEDHGHYLKRALEIGAHVERFVNIVLARGEGFVDTRLVWGLLTLNKAYANSDIDRACEAVLELNQVNLKTVRQLLTITAERKSKKQNLQPSGGSSPGERAQVEGGKFARPISEYKQHLKLVHTEP